jgi:toxin ParE1/3/4
MAEWTLSENAADDLIEIFVYMYREFGEWQAETYTEEIESKFSILAENPKMGREISEITGEYRQSVYHSHVIVYRAERQGIFIVRVLHRRQNKARILREGPDGPD